MEGITTGVDDTAQYFSKLIDEHGFNRVSIIGSSGGGYAALGQLIGADAIHCIAPRTRLYHDPEEYADRERHVVLRIPDSLDELWSRPVRQEQYFDLTNLLNLSRFKAIFAAFTTTRSLGRYHAQHLSGLLAIELEELPGAKHQVAKQLGSSPDFFPSVIDCR